MGQSKHERSQASHPVSQAPLVPLHELEHPIQRTPMGASLSQRARRDPRSLSLSEVRFLQRTTGNRAVSQLFQAPAQRSAAGTSPLAGMSPLIQADRSLASSTLPPLQPRASGPDTPGEVLTEKKVPLHQVAESAHPKENTTGLPDALKAGVESLSGLSLDDVQVSYNSPQPSEIQALAYTQGTTIHVAPGQEKHLAHEAWHVVQQKLGTVKPTLQAKGVAINDDQRLEQEAAVMGARAVSGVSAPVTGQRQQNKGNLSSPPIQRIKLLNDVMVSSFDPSKIINLENAVITAAATKDDSIGGHAELFLEIIDQVDNLAKTYLIHLVANGKTGEVFIKQKLLQWEYKPGMLASLLHSRSIEGELAMPAVSQSYLIPRQKAFIAMGMADKVEKEAREGKIKYMLTATKPYSLLSTVTSTLASYFTGAPAPEQVKYMNCTDFAQELLQVAGVQVASGGIASRPAAVAASDPRSKQEIYYEQGKM